MGRQSSNGKAELKWEGLSPIWGCREGWYALPGGVGVPGNPLGGSMEALARLV